MEVSGMPALQDVPLPWQQDIWRSLSARLTEGKLPHALLITGEAGLGKTLLATAFARLALCRSPVDGMACGSCASCTQFAAGAHADFRRIELEERDGKAGEDGQLKSAISVEQIRDLIGSLQLSSSRHGGRKVALIEPAELMSISAANGLLKTLEEPPEDTVLLLVTAAPGRLPATVRSRCQSVAVAAPATTTALEWLKARLPREDWPVLLGFCAGAPLAALALATTGIETRRQAFFAALARLRSREANPVMLAVHPKDAYPELLRLLWSFVSDLILIRNAGAGAPVVNRDQLALLQKTAEGINLRSLHAYLDRIQAAIQALDTPANRELTFSVLLAEWADGLEGLQNAPLAAHTKWGWT
jgi:DNA polymerase-3 subunit delta'